MDSAAQPNPSGPRDAPDGIGSGRTGAPAASLPGPPLRGLTLSRRGLDRSAHRRTEPGLLDTLRQREGTRVLRLRAGRAPVRTDGGEVRLAWVPPSQVPEPGEDDLLLYLGSDGGVEHVAHISSAEPPEEEGGQWWGLRQAGLLLGEVEAMTLTEAVAMANWHAVTRYSPRTGHRLRPEQAGWVKVDVEDGAQHFPRTDAAVIMGVIDELDRLLLGRQPVWPANRYSVLAGFVEPGESFEATVRREAHEEAGVVIGDQPGDVVYLGSQPWPFPASIMVAFAARAVDGRIDVDGEEIEHARWFTREELAAEITAGRVIAPSALSIARRIVEAWFSGPLPEPEDGSRW
ncbi:NAD+ diphosphatase [Kineococcus xinjiangensis]|uniref:NAD(+) diphosphatase n=1 Tax=Kineococcus xinjiangensis TaxID=512762 RepID=A0A2S6IWM7_9ACTN|nr:NAD(+) diphosphatase [Kineococcus xinjiangensis]PPK98757.1 NAD+ diphosphatase [Kineococcus xinjiangensis]